MWLGQGWRQTLWHYGTAMRGWDSGSKWYRVVFTEKFHQSKVWKEQ